MAHAIESAFYVGEKAWHGLGTMLDVPPTISEALKLSGLDWSVSTRPVFIQTDDGQFLQLTTGHQAVLRDSDMSHLGCVGSGYAPIQNAKAFEPFQPLIDAGIVQLEAAGSLREGRRVWILGKITGAIAEVVPGDAVKGYVVFYNGHDGSLQAAYQKTKIRVVCDNTVQAADNAAQRGDESRIVFRHTGDVNAKIDGLTDAFRQASFNFASELASFRAIAAKPIADTETLKVYFGKVLKLDERKKKTTAAQLVGLPEPVAQAMEAETGKRQLEQLFESYDTQPGREYASGSYWQAYNAVTYWVDHVRGRNEENRQNASWFGDGQSLRNRAMSVALAA